MNHKVAVVCPVYKNSLTEEEALSLQNTVKKLGNYDFFFAAPQNLPLYHFNKYHKDTAKIIRFDSYFFQSTKTYNKLLLSKEFYQEWISYEYILIFQLDCYIFQSNLAYWINKEYDYVGAPWFEGYTKPTKNTAITGVGNGGLSLRKTSTFLHITQDFKWRKLLSSPHYFGLQKSLYKYIKHKIVRWNINEDLFWGQIAPKVYSTYKLSTIEDAIKFSFEKNPELLFELNNQTLPFGCHALGRYNIKFWCKYIPELTKINHNS